MSHYNRIVPAAPDMSAARPGSDLMEEEGCRAPPLENKLESARDLGGSLRVFDRVESRVQDCHVAVG